MTRSRYSGDFKLALPECFRAAMLALADLAKLFEDGLQVCEVIGLPQAPKNGKKGVAGLWG